MCQVMALLLLCRVGILDPGVRRVLAGVRGIPAGPAITYTSYVVNSATELKPG